MSEGTHWAVSESTLDPGSYNLLAVHGSEVPRSMSGSPMRYLDCRDLVLGAARVDDTYIELHLGQDPTELYLVVIEDRELGTVRLMARDGSDG